MGRSAQTLAAPVGTATRLPLATWRHTGASVYRSSQRNAKFPRRDQQLAVSQFQTDAPGAHALIIALQGSLCSVIT